MYLLFLLAVVAYFVVVAIKEVQKTKRLLSVPITEKVRVKNYLGIIAFGWGTLLAVLIMCLYAEINFTDIGLRRLSFDYNIWFNIAVFVLSGAVFAMCLYQIIASFVSAEHRKAAMEMFGDDAGKSNYDKVIATLIPRSKKEKLVFLGVPITAGIMEEILARGFLFLIIQTLFPYLSIIFVVLISSVLFGVAHAYQGIIGVIKSTLLGVLFGCLYLVTGSLIPSIILHFFIDFTAVFMFNEKEMTV